MFECPVPRSPVRAHHNRKSPCKILRIPVAGRQQPQIVEIPQPLHGISLRRGVRQSVCGAKTCSSECGLFRVTPTVSTDLRLFICKFRPGHWSGRTMPEGAASLSRCSKQEQPSRCSQQRKESPQSQFHLSISAYCCAPSRPQGTVPKQL